MSADQYGVNAINANGKNLLLTEAGGGAAVHLTREVASAESGRGAVPDYWFQASSGGTERLRSNYDRAALLDPRWAEKTLCGRLWVSMASGEGGLLHQFDVREAYAPTCKRCLALMDQLFPRPTPDDRLNLIVQVITDLVLEHGYAEIQGVPGDQQAVLRAKIRAAVRQSTGYRAQTHVLRSMVVVVCDALYEQHAEEHDRRAREAMNMVMERAMTGGDVEPVRSPEWRTHWDAWSVG